MDALLKLSVLLLLCLSPVLSAPSNPSAAIIGISHLDSAPSSSIGGNCSLPTPQPQSAHSETIASAVSDLRFGAVRLQDLDPNLIKAFDFTNTSLLLSIPDGLLAPLGSNRTLARVHVLPFYPRFKNATISVGEDEFSLSKLSSLLPATRNALRDNGMRSISVSTTFSFVCVLKTAFPRPAASFQETIGEAAIRPLLQFLQGTNPTFLRNLYQYNQNGLALFQEGAFSFRDDFATGVRYGNLTEDAVLTSFAVSGDEDIPLVVADPNPAYLKTLVGQLISSNGTPPRKEAVAQAYIDELVEADPKQQLHHLEVSFAPKNWAWGIVFVMLFFWVLVMDTPDESEAWVRVLLGTLICVAGFGVSLLKLIRVDNVRRMVYVVMLGLLHYLMSKWEHLEAGVFQFKTLQHHDKLEIIFAFMSLEALSLECPYDGKTNSLLQDAAVSGIGCYYSDGRATAQIPVENERGSHLSKEGWMNLMDSFHRRMAVMVNMVQYKNHCDSLKWQWRIWSKLVATSDMKWDLVAGALTFPPRLTGPFSYWLVVHSANDDGAVFCPEVVDLTEDDLVGKFTLGISMATALSLAIANPTLAVAPNMFASGRASEGVLEGS
ncbi:unnamed protein product [Linum tenue]|uniref:glucan endo-1,3-beta-D-glucosidase n=1 Tax=Linum tenue TaxID=586396 RepID=A0AAV0K1A9_9ROSI|nr:unnamed protein product [Linum tenue]